MRRRDFFEFFAFALAWPIAARAQSTKLPTIGFLGAGGQSAWTYWTTAFVQRLHELGWVEGRTVAIEYRWAEGRTERIREIAAEFVRLEVDVIVAVGGAVLAAKEVTTKIPIVFALAVDPIWHRYGRLTGAAGRQCYRRVVAVDGISRQTDWALARNSS